MANPQGITDALRALAGPVPIAIQRPPPTRAIRGGVRMIPAPPPPKPVSEPPAPADSPRTKGPSDGEAVALARALEWFWSQDTNRTHRVNTRHWRG